MLTRENLLPDVARKRLLRRNYAIKSPFYVSTHRRQATKNRQIINTLWRRSSPSWWQSWANFPGKWVWQVKFNNSQSQEIVLHRWMNIYARKCIEFCQEEEMLPTATKTATHFLPSSTGCGWSLKVDKNKIMESSKVFIFLCNGMLGATSLQVFLE